MSEGARSGSSPPPRARLDLSCDPASASLLAAAVLFAWGGIQLSGRAAPTLSTFLTMLLLAMGWGGVIGLLTHRMRRGGVLATVLWLPLPLLEVDEIAWAVRRVSELYATVGNAAVWVVATVAGGAVYLAVVRLLGREDSARAWSRFSGGAAGLVTVAMCLDPLQRRATAVAVGLFWVGAALFAGVVAWGRHTRVLAIVGLVGTAVALTWLPDTYVRLTSAVTGVGLGFALFGVREAFAFHRRRRQHRSSRVGARWWWAVSLIAFCSVGSLWSASDAVDREEAVWRAHPRDRSLLSVLVRRGQLATDFDGDGHGLIFGQHDCAPFEPTAFPGAHEIPGNPIDENCLGGPEPAGTAARVRAAEAINAPPQPWRRHGDVVLVVIDTLRWDAVQRADLPTFRALAAESVVFERAVAHSSFTAMSLMGVLGGRLPTGFSLQWQGRFNAYPAAPPSGLGTWLTSLGYETALAGAADSRDNEYFQPETYGNGFRVRELGRMSDPASRTTDLALRAWRRLDPSRPRFLWAHYMWVHHAQGAEEYSAAVREVDRELGRLRAGLGTDALWVVTSDHGEEHGEHGGSGHAQTLYREVMHVPLFLRIPGRAARREPTVAPLRSIPPTVMALVAPDEIPQGRGPYLCVGQRECRSQPAPLALEMRDTHLHGFLSEESLVVRDIGRGHVVDFGWDRVPGLSAEVDGAINALEWWEEHLYGSRTAYHWWPYRVPAFPATRTE